MKEELLAKLNSREATIGIIGLGYVGLPLALAYSSKSYKVIGFDNQDSKVHVLNSGKSFIKHISDSSIKDALKEGFKATMDISNISEVDAIIICVPTPLNEYREPDLHFIKESVENIKPYLNAGQAICLVSTTYPGTTEEEILPHLKDKGFKVGEDIFLVYSPEREDPGNENYETSNIPKVVGGLTEECLEIGISLFKNIINEVVPVSSLKVAEITKLLENIYRAVNIGLVNDLKKITDKMDIDIFEVIEAASSKPFGYKAFYPGPGLGGHCIPIDPFYLSWKSREYGIYSHFIELAGEINSEMPDWVIGKIAEALNDNSKSIKDSKILILGVSYKKDVDDLRESPSLSIIKSLLLKGAHISFSDPHIKTLQNPIQLSEQLESVKLSSETLSSFDLCVLVTDHSDFDYELIRRGSNLIIDTRGKFSPEKNIIYRA